MRSDAAPSVRIREALLRQRPDATDTPGPGKIDAENAMKAPDALAPTAIYEPGPRESVERASATKNQLLVGITENVKGRVLVLRGRRRGLGRTPRSRCRTTPRPISEVHGAGANA
jgi:hypothetical protein